MTAMALDAAGIEYVAIDRGDCLSSSQQPTLRAEVLICHFNAETALTDYAWLATRVKANWRIGYWAWELSTFPDEWMHAFGLYNEIWASTVFARDAFASRSPRPVHLMPMVVDIPAPGTSVSRAHFRLPKDRFLFFTNFDFRSFTARKNPIAAIRAFQQAFPTGRERVGLVVKTLHADHDLSGWHQLQLAAHRDRRIILVNRNMARIEIAGLMGVCDAYVSLHRSEGFGRGPAEAMLLGKPIIVTAYSGNMDFCRGDNACLVPAQLVPVKPGEYIGAEGAVWADADINVAANHMQRLAQDPVYCHQLGTEGRATIMSLYRADRIGSIYRTRLEDILQ